MALTDASHGIRRHQYHNGDPGGRRPLHMTIGLVQRRRIRMTTGLDQRWRIHGTSGCLTWYSSDNTRWSNHIRLSDFARQFTENLIFMSLFQPQIAISSELFNNLHTALNRGFIDDRFPAVHRIRCQRSRFLYEVAQRGPLS